MIGTWRQKQAQQTMLDGLVSAGTEDSDTGKIVSDAARDAVEVATTVKITQDALDAMDEKVMAGDIHGGAVALLKALGFEVVQ